MGPLDQKILDKIPAWPPSTDRQYYRSNGDQIAVTTPGDSLPSAQRADTLKRSFDATKETELKQSTILYSELPKPFFLKLQQLAQKKYFFEQNLQMLLRGYGLFPRMQDDHARNIRNYLLGSDREIQYLFECYPTKGGLKKWNGLDLKNQSTLRNIFQKNTLPEPAQCDFQLLSLMGWTGLMNGTDYEQWYKEFYLFRQRELAIDNWQALGWKDQKSYETWLNKKSLFAFSSMMHYCTTKCIFEQDGMGLVFREKKSDEAKSISILSINAFEFRGYSGDIDTELLNQIEEYSCQILKNILMVARDQGKKNVVLVPYGLGVFLGNKELDRIKEKFLQGMNRALKEDAQQSSQLNIYYCGPENFYNDIIRPNVASNKSVTIGSVTVRHVPGKDAYFLTQALEDSVIVNAGDSEWMECTGRRFMEPGQCFRGHTLTHQTADEYLGIMTEFPLYSIPNLLTVDPRCEKFYKEIGDLVAPPVLQRVAAEELSALQESGKPAPIAVEDNAALKRKISQAVSEYIDERKKSWQYRWAAPSTSGKFSLVQRFFHWIFKRYDKVQSAKTFIEKLSSTQDVAQDVSLSEQGKMLCGNTNTTIDSKLLNSGFFTGFKPGLLEKKIIDSITIGGTSKKEYKAN